MFHKECSTHGLSVWLFHVFVEAYIQKFHLFRQVSVQKLNFDEKVAALSLHTETVALSLRVLPAKAKVCCHHYHRIIIFTLFMTKILHLNKSMITIRK